MPLYRFYRIVSSEGPEEYIGSTTQPLNQRFNEHRSHHKRGKGTASGILFMKYGAETCSILLISEQEMEKIDALREERRLMEESPMAVNKIRPIREKEERREEDNERNRKYCEKHREAIKTRLTEKIPCDTCGKICSRNNMARHKRTCVPPQQ